MKIAFAGAAAGHGAHPLQGPQKVVLLYVKDHSENLHATCVVCARSTILTGDERDRILPPRRVAFARSASPSLVSTSAFQLSLAQEPWLTC